MEIKIGVMVLAELPEEQRQFLINLRELTTVAQAAKAMIPVYYRDQEGNVFFVEDYILYDNKTFEKTAPTGLYRGGALMKLMTKFGQVVLFDERSQWLRQIGGIAKYSEGDDLSETAIRESVIEELAVVAIMPDKSKIRLVPEGMSQFVGLTINSWEITTAKVQETGIISFVEYFFNDSNKAFEYVVEWDISEWDNLRVFHAEDWFEGGRSGFTPFVIDSDGNVVGIYDGQHGFASFPITKLHPTLQATL